MGGLHGRDSLTASWTNSDTRIGGCKVKTGKGPPPSLLVTEDAWPPRCTHRQAAQISQTAQLAQQPEGRPRRPSDPHLAAPGNLGPSCQTRLRGCLRTQGSGQAGERWGLWPCAHCAGQVRWRRLAPSKPRETTTPLPIQSPAVFPTQEANTCCSQEAPLQDGGRKPAWSQVASAAWGSCGARCTLSAHRESGSAVHSGPVTSGHLSQSAGPSVAGRGTPEPALKPQALERARPQHTP